MVNFLIRLGILAIVVLLEDKLIYKRIRKIDKKERQKIDAEELKTYQKEIEYHNQLEELKK